ncbi:hypothetical protein CKO_04568 [Citrobacter koseri ATCC BAA-895]|uniref:Uncharacterized protein n=1 Tax=Citrobacter koseri (strain ATCC BAA-895 / CDC 4225-83 / SGSC4696) TaxID=290338 RepID=A8AQ59_CITK8|nr:hypothetical protein CKO_04568 [Citrobacter koseri ATCC BAA-895]
MCGHRVISRLRDTGISELLYQAIHGGLYLCGQRFYGYICHAVPSCYSLLRFVAEPANITGSHNQLTGFFVGQPFDISQIINALLSEIFQRTNTTGSQFECQVATQSFQIQQIVRRFVITKAFFLGQCQSGQCVFGTLAQRFNGRFIQPVDFQQFFHWHVGQFFQRRETFFNQYGCELFINIEIFGEGIDSCMCFSLMLSLQVINRHHVKFPAAQLRSQTDVLTITSDRLSQVTGFNSDIHGVFIFIHHDRSDVCWRHRVNHELRRVIIPQDDIDTLAAQFSRNGLNARTTHTHTGADRIDTLVVGFHRDFRTGTRIAGRRFNLNDFFADFRYFNTEQLDQHFRFGTRHKQLRTARFRANGVQNATNTVARTEVFARQHIFTQDHGFSIAAQIQRDVVAVYFLHHAGDDFAFVLAELIDHHRTLGFTNFLYDNLFCRLGGDTVKGDRFNLIFNVVAQVQAFVFKTRRFQRNFFCRQRDFFYD